MKELKQFIKESLLDDEETLLKKDLNPIERIFLAKNREEYNNAMQHYNYLRFANE